MKLSKEEWQRIDEIDKGSTVSGHDADFLLACLSKLRPKPERFTYEMRDCDHVHCDKGKVYTLGGWFKCQGCGGLGKIRTKVKRTAHSV